MEAKTGLLRRSTTIYLHSLRNTRTQTGSSSTAAAHPGAVLDVQDGEIVQM